MTGAEWLALATLICGFATGLFKIWVDLQGVHKLVNSEMAKARDMMAKAVASASELAFARGYEEGGRNARAVSAKAMVAAAAALPPVIVAQPIPEPIMGEPDPNHSGIRRP